ncbi:hypothetical protein [Aeromonas dhakensis]|uniref:hypothetical protein n=1 Tax=Aeromonas dhakensis TaxID=196024 RepID=UPI003B9F2284
MLLVIGGVASLTGDWAQTLAEAIIERVLDVKATGVAGQSVGISLLVLGLFLLFGRGAYKHHYRNDLPPTERLAVAMERFKIQEQKLEDLLRDLVRVHSSNYPNDPHFSPLASAGVAGDRLSLVSYLSSVLVGQQPMNFQVQVFNVLDDFTCRPVAHKYIKEFEALQADARQVGLDNAIENTPLFRAYKLLENPLFEAQRKSAYWPDGWRNV